MTSKSDDMLNSEKKLIRQLDSMVSEEQNPDTLNIDLLATSDILNMINRQDHDVPAAVKQAIPEITLAVDEIVQAFKLGGRLIYMGAGTSGRLGVLDAVECPPTFSVPDNMIIALIAGGDSAIYKAVEGAEDSQTLAIEDLKKINFNQQDILVGIAASGRTPYVIAGLKYANEIGATSVSVSCNPGSKIQHIAKIGICAEVGPEVLTGSTRMKSGTAQKLILNMLTTASMIRMGKSYQNLMVDVHASNEKLYARASRIVMQATGCDHHQAKAALEQAEYSAKTAILMILTGLTFLEAKSLLLKHDGFLRSSIADHGES